jgi:endonuclease YncB( thermonuclease family)
VSCEPSGTDRYGRTLAICFESGEDLNRLMVHDGQAIACVEFSDRYLREEERARGARRGIWSTVFERPSDWRRSH